MRQADKRFCVRRKGGVYGFLIARKCVSLLQEQGCCTCIEISAHGGLSTEGREVEVLFFTNHLCCSPAMDADGLLLILYLRRNLCPWRISVEGCASFSGHASSLLLIQARTRGNLSGWIYLQRIPIP